MYLNLYWTLAINTPLPSLTESLHTAGTREKTAEVIRGLIYKISYDNLTIILQ